MPHVPTRRRNSQGGTVEKRFQGPHPRKETEAALAGRESREAPALNIMPIKRLKVVHVITRLEFGGAQQNVLYTLNHMDHGFFEPILACGQGGYLDDEAHLTLNFATEWVRWLVPQISPFRDLLALRHLYHFFRTEHPDVVHTHSSKAGILGRIAAWLAGVPTIIHTYHGFGFNVYQRQWVSFLYVSLERFCAKVSKELVFVSKANRLLACELMIPCRAQGALIRSGIQRDSFHRHPSANLIEHQRVRANHGISHRGKFVVSVGNKKPQKNNEGMIYVAAMVQHVQPSTQFALIGGDKESFVGSRIRCVGWKEPREVAEILSVADVFVLTSLWEGLPRALLEAMKSGLPCVCYAVDGITEVIQSGKNGFLVEPDDDREMARIILRLLDARELAQEIGRQASLSIGSEFDIDHMVNQQERLYQKLAR